MTGDFIAISPDGAKFFPEFLDRTRQEAIVEALRPALKQAPLFTPEMPRTGKPFSVRMTNLGEIGWVSDRTGYRYQPAHPATGEPWPDIPQCLTDIWQSVTPEGTPLPDCCLVNYYSETAKMGLHRDEDEKDTSHPVVSVSLGDDALFRLGGLARNDKTRSFRLRSGDVLVLASKDRMAFHGIGRIYPGTSTLLSKGGRINLTMRVAR